MTTSQIVGKCVRELILDRSLRRATKYVTPKFTVKATRQRPRTRDMQDETFLVSIGRPNYRERKFIRDCVKAGVRFPVRNVLLTYWPKKRGKK